MVCRKIWSSKSRRAYWQFSSFQLAGLLLSQNRGFVTVLVVKCTATLCHFVLPVDIIQKPEPVVITCMC